MLPQIKKELSKSILAVIGAGVIGSTTQLFIQIGFPDHQIIASLIGLLIFTLLVMPIPVYFAETSMLVKAASFDVLTGLYNRSSLYDQFERLMSESIKKKCKFHLLILDLNKFKQVNDSLGHPIGDQLLVHVAEHLRDAIRECDIVARLGGDEFAILVPDCDDTSAYDAVIAKITKAISSPVTIEHHNLYIRASIGVATFPTTATSVMDLMRCADIAMYSAKRTGKDFCVYKEEDDVYNANDIVLLGELRAAIDDGDCELWFQPKRNIKTRKIDAAECLIRWRHPTRGIIGPNTFIPIAESSGLIRNITQFVIKQAATSYSILRQAGHDLDLSVNVSPVDIVDPALMPTIIKSIVRADMLPSKLILEVTETAIMHDPMLAFKVLIALESLGIKLSIDDFGTGHSSLMYLKNFPIYEVKLDKSFVSDIDVNKEGRNIVKSTVDLAHSLNAIATAEGVDSYEIQTLLEQLNCDYIQGYYVAKPMPITEFIQWLNQNNDIDAHA